MELFYSPIAHSCESCQSFCLEYQEVAFGRNERGTRVSRHQHDRTRFYGSFPGEAVIIFDYTLSRMESSSLAGCSFYTSLLLDIGNRMNNSRFIAAFYTPTRLRFGFVAPRPPSPSTLRSENRSGKASLEAFPKFKVVGPFSHSFQLVCKAGM
jgi:hypothetical protein